MWTIFSDIGSHDLHQNCYINIFFVPDHGSEVRITKLKVAATLAIPNRKSCLKRDRNGLENDSI